MRIRKNAKLFSSILPSHASLKPETPQAHVCQLNQSPWDVVPLDYSCPSLNYQFEGEVSVTGNGSFGDSMGAVESVASMMNGEENKAEVRFAVDDEMVIDDNENDVSQRNKLMEDQLWLLGEGEGEGLLRRREPRHGHALCDHHLSSQQQQLKSYSSNISNNNTCSSSVTNSIKKNDKAVAACSSRARGRARAAGKKGLSSNPYEFYYYSGFGPSWGKRRGGRVIADVKRFEDDNRDAEHKHISSGNDHKTTSSPCSSKIEIDEFDFEDDDDEDEDEDDCGKRRVRKPVKARSLKSLM